MVNFIIDESTMIQDTIFDDELYLGGDQTAHKEKI